MAIYEVGEEKTYATPQEAVDALFNEVEHDPFTETHIIDIYSGVYDSYDFMNSGNHIVMFIHTLNPTPEYPLIIRAHPGEEVTFRLLASGASIVFSQVSYTDSISNVYIDGIHFTVVDDDSSSGYSIVPWYDIGVGQDVSKNFYISNCTFGYLMMWLSCSHLQNVFLYNCLTTGYSSPIYSPIGPYDGSNSFSGIFSAEKCAWYSEAGPELRPAENDLIVVKLHNCVVWGQNTGFKVLNGDAAPYRLYFEARNNIFCIKRANGRLLVLLPCNSESKHQVYIDSDYNCFSAPSPWTGRYIACNGEGATGETYTLEETRTYWGSETNSFYTTDPKFVDCGEYMKKTIDLRLMSDSPCINAGIKEVDGSRIFRRDLGFYDTKHYLPSGGGGGGGVGGVNYSGFKNLYAYTKIKVGG